MDEIVPAVNALFFGDADARNRANQYLMRLPEHGEIWTLVPQLLQHEQFHVQFIGTQLVYNKIRFHFDADIANKVAGALTTLAHAEHLAPAVLQKLCATLAALVALQVLTLHDVLCFEPHVALGVLENVPDELQYRNPMVYQVHELDYVRNMDVNALMQFLRRGVNPKVVPQCLTVFVNWARVMDLRFLNDAELARALISQMSDPLVIDCITEGLMRTPQAQGLWEQFSPSRQTVVGPEGECLKAVVEYLKTPAFDSHEWVQALSVVCECYLQVAFAHEHILHAVGALFQHNAKLSMMLVKFFQQIADLKSEGLIGVEELKFILPVITEPCMKGMLRFLTPGELDADDAEDYEQCARNIVFKLLVLWQHLDHGEYFLSLLDPTTVAGLKLLEECKDAFDEALPPCMIQKLGAMLHVRQEVVPHMAALIGCCARHLELHPEVIPFASQFIFNNLHFPTCASAFVELAGSVGHLLPVSCVEPLVTHVEAARLPVASDANCFAAAMCIVRSRTTFERDAEHLLEKCYNMERARSATCENVPVILFRLFKRIEMCLSVVDDVEGHDEAERKKMVSTAIFDACGRNFDSFADGCAFALTHGTELAEVAGKAAQRTIRHLKDASAAVQTTCGARFLQLAQRLPLKWALVLTKECLPAEHAPQDISVILDAAFRTNMNEDTLVALFALIQRKADFATSKWSERTGQLALRVLAECDEPNLIKNVLGFLAKAMRRARQQLSEADGLELHSTVTLAVLNNLHKWDNRCDKILIPLLEALADRSSAPFASFLQSDGPIQAQLDANRKEVCLRCFRTLRAFQLTMFIRDLRSIARKERSVDALLACEMMVPAG